MEAPRAGSRGDEPEQPLLASIRTEPPASVSATTSGRRSAWAWADVIGGWFHAGPRPLHGAGAGGGTAPGARRPGVGWQGAIATAALLLLIVSLAGLAVGFAVLLVLVIVSLGLRVERPWLLVASAVALGFNTFLLHSIPPPLGSGALMALGLAIWVLEGLLIHSLLVELLSLGFATSAREPAPLLDEEELERRVQGRTAALSELNASLRSELHDRIEGQLMLSRQALAFRSIFDGIGDAVVVVEGGDSPLLFNVMAMRLFGGDDREAITHWLQAAQIEDADPRSSRPGSASSRPLARALRGEEVEDFEAFVHPQDSGPDRWIHVRGWPMRGTNALWRGSIIVFHDVTEQRRSVQDLQKAKEAAEKASQAKDQFLAILSHELRTPLTPVLLGTSALLERPDLDSEVRSTLAMIHRNAAIESRLIDDLLDMTRTATGRLTLNLSIVDAHRIIEHAAEVCRAGIEEAQLELRLELNAEDHFLHADPARLQQVFWNLINNAVKFTPAGGRITVRTHNITDPANPKGVRLIAEVADTGIGIEPERLPRIFSAFKEKDPVRHRRYGGLGLGLAISRSVVENHGGRLSAASPGVDQGTVFTVDLAAQAASPARLNQGESAGQSARSAGSPPRPEGLRILLVEDNRDTLRYIALILQQRNHIVSMAHNIRIARRLAASSPFDLIVSDIELPDGSGLDLMREINAIRPTPGIALSGFGSVDDLILSQGAGFIEHLTKPIDIRSLDTAIAKVIPWRSEASPALSGLSAASGSGKIPVSAPQPPSPRPAPPPPPSASLTPSDELDPDGSASAGS
jgi:signal transduction histidine kinase/CheY-like chemotaxis protein